MKVNIGYIHEKLRLPSPPPMPPFHLPANHRPFFFQGYINHRDHLTKAHNKAGYSNLWGRFRWHWGKCRCFGVPVGIIYPQTKAMTVPGILPQYILPIGWLYATYHLFTRTWNICRCKHHPARKKKRCSCRVPWLIMFGFFNIDILKDSFWADKHWFFSWPWSSCLCFLKMHESLDVRWCEICIISSGIISLKEQVGFSSLIAEALWHGI